MAKCKFCGQGVRTAPVFHPACWECVITELLRMGGNEV